MCRVMIIGCVIISLVGCAEMQVKKVTLHDRVTEEDTDVKGFRYYLSRPYVVVRKPIEVNKSKSLIVIPTASGDDTKAPCSDSPELKTATYLSGPKRGEVVSLKEIQVAMERSGSVETVSIAELESFRTKLNQSAGGQVQMNAHMNTAGQVPVQTVQDTASLLPDAPIGGTTTPAPRNDITMPAGDIEVLFLPDLDEQYAVHNKNCLAKSSYALKFKDGWQLTDVNGDFDSTTVAIELLNTVQKAIEQARDVEKTRIEEAAKRAPNAMDQSPASQQLPDGRIFQLIQTTYLVPGIYRVNKPWEIDPAFAQSAGYGLLAQMGLPTETQTEILPAANTQIP